MACQPPGPVTRDKGLAAYRIDQDPARHAAASRTDDGIEYCIGKPARVPDVELQVAGTGTTTDVLYQRPEDRAGIGQQRQPVALQQRKTEDGFALFR